LDLRVALLFISFWMNLQVYVKEEK